MHVLHGAVFANDDAHRNRHWRGARLHRRDLAQHLVAGRVVPDAGGSGALRSEGEAVEALHKSLPLIGTLRRQRDTDEMAADLRDYHGAVEPDAAEVDAPCRSLAHRHLGGLTIDA